MTAQEMIKLAKRVQAGERPMLTYHLDDVLRGRTRLRDAAAFLRELARTPYPPETEPNKHRDMIK
jgi:hypothetical protein